MITNAQLEAEAQELVDRVLPLERDRAMACAYGFLDQTVKCFLAGELRRSQLRRNRALVERALDLHRKRRDRAC